MSIYRMPDLISNTDGIEKKHLEIIALAAQFLMPTPSNISCTQRNGPLVYVTFP